MTGKYTPLLILFLFSFTLLFSKETPQDSHGEEEPLNVGEMIMHHVLDSHDWHITDFPLFWKEGHEYIPIAVHLPWIFYSSRDGLVFSSTHGLADRGYLAHHDKLYALKVGAHPEGGHGDGHGEGERTRD